MSEESPWKIFQGVFDRFEEDSLTAVKRWEKGQRQALMDFAERLNDVAKQEIKVLERKRK
jgi:hypothetical protein